MSRFRTTAGLVAYEEDAHGPSLGSWLDLRLVRRPAQRATGGVSWTLFELSRGATAITWPELRFGARSVAR